MASMMPAPLAAAAAIRWISLAALALVIGGLVLDVVILPATAPALVPARRRLRAWTGGAVVVLLAASAGELVVRARTMSGGSLGVAIAAVPLVLGRTHFGLVWTARLAALVGLLILSFGRLRTLRLALACGIALTTTLTGHAADRGDFTLSALVDWGHVLAASAWVGGLLGLALVALVERPDWPAAPFAAVVRRFSTLAGLCLAVVVASGVYNAWWQLGAPSQLWTTFYGRVLAVKLLAVLALVGLGAANRYALLPRLDRDGRLRPGVLRSAVARFPGPDVDPASVAPRLTTNVAREAALAIVVLACTAVLGESMPARQSQAPAHHVEGDRADSR